MKPVRPIATILLVFSLILSGCGIITITPINSTVPSPTETETPEPERPPYTLRTWTGDTEGVWAEVRERCDQSLEKACETLNYYRDWDLTVYTLLSRDTLPAEPRFQRLTEEEKGIYRQLEEAERGVLDYRIVEKSLSGGFGTFVDAYDALAADHKELALYAYFNYDYFTDSYFPLYFHPDANANHPTEDLDALRDYITEQFALIEALKTYVLARMPAGLSDSDQCLFLAAFLCGYCKYDDSMKSDMDPWQAYNALVRRHPVCAGYAEAYEILLQAAGFACTEVIGASPGGEPHAWNRVETTAGPRYVDVTFIDTSTVIYDINFTTRYFFMTEEELLKEGYEPREVQP